MIVLCWRLGFPHMNLGTMQTFRPQQHLKALSLNQKSYVNGLLPLHLISYHSFLHLPCTGHTASFVLLEIQSSFLPQDLYMDSLCLEVSLSWCLHSWLYMNTWTLAHILLLLEAFLTTVPKAVTSHSLSQPSFRSMLIIYHLPFI
jgi:hypothetical protein